MEIAERLGYPVVLKISSPDIIHKSDFGGVRINLANAEQVRDAFDLMMLRIQKRAPNAHLRGGYVEKMGQRGREVILGMTRDPQFGPMLMFGLGGIFVEVMKDVTFHLAPITAEEAMQMLKGTRSYALLQGARGQAPVDLDAIAGALQRISQLATDYPEIKELDINPFIVGPVGVQAYVADARMTLSNVVTDGRTMSKPITYDPNWQETYQSQILTAAEAVKKIRPGQRIFIGTGAAEPLELVSALSKRATELPDTEIVHLLTFGEAPYAHRELAQYFRVNSFFIAENVRDIIQEGLGDYTPIHLSDIPRLFDSGQLPLDVALIQVTPPDQYGMCSLGVSVDIVKSAAENASLVIAQVNPNMPRTLGDCFIHVNDIDVLVPSDAPILEVPAAGSHRDDPADCRIHRGAGGGRLDHRIRHRPHPAGDVRLF